MLRFMEKIKSIFNFVRQYWKIMLAIAYMILVPLYSYQSTAKMRQTLEISQESSDGQIKILQGAMEEQRVQYDKMFKEYQAKIEEEKKRYDDEIVELRKTQEKHQKLLSKKFKENPSAISDELSKRYGLNAN